MITPYDSFNPGSGGYADNREWVALADGLRAFVAERDDAALIDLRAMVEASEGRWWDWRNLHTRDGLHVKGPYWHANGNINWECHPYENGAMLFAGMIWDELVRNASGERPEDPFEFCALDFNRTCVIDGGDLNLLLANWGPVEPGSELDLDGDGVVDGADLFLFLSDWGACP